MELRPDGGVNVSRPASRSIRSDGRMTRVMRALSAPEGPRVLRVGLVRDGRVVEERLFENAIDVSLGDGELATFAAPCATCDVLVRRADGYVLVVSSGMQARLADARGVHDLGPGESRALDGESRGKVRIGDTTLLFQMVVAPIPAARPQLPLSVKSGSADVDWNLTILVALSFLLHFGFVGALYSDWVDPIVRDAPSVAGLVDLVKSTPRALPLETPKTDDSSSKPESPKAEAKRDTPSSSSPGRASASPGRASPGASSDKGQAARDAALIAQAENMRVEIAASLTGSSSVQNALKRSNVPVVDVGEAAAKNTSVSGEVSTSSGGPIASSKSSGLADLGKDGTKRSGPDSAGPARETRGPSLDTRVEPTRASMPVSDADRVVAGLKPAFRRCYQLGLDQDASQSGRVVVSAKIAPTGEVASADVASIQGLSASIGACVARAVRGAQFSAPGGTGSTLQIPVSLVQNAR
jgi:hypothetical protein